MTAADAASDAARRFLRLHLAAGIGPILTARLLQHFGGIDALLAASPAHLSRVNGIGPERADALRNVDDVAVQHELDAAAERGARIICLEDEEYPALLRKITDPPVCLYLRGRLQPEDAVALAVVGTRRCSAYGVEQAERLSGLAAEAGLTIVSGMAAGIDSAAHRGALRGGGRTLAVLGCGLNHLYPSHSGELADRIAASGAVLTEFPMDIPPAEGNFPRRNRIIAGLSLGVLVVEAPSRSGALITARLASEYNREVFAVPGRVDNAFADGCHGLIRSGAAKLVTCLPDILDELGDVGTTLRPAYDNGRETGPDSANAYGLFSRDPTGERVEKRRRPSDGPDAAEPAVAASSGEKGITDARLSRLNEYERQVFDAMSVDPASIETLTAVTGLPPARVAASLTSLQLKGLARRVAGDAYVKGNVA